MGFDMGDTEDSVGFGKYEAEIMNAGVAHGGWGDQMIFVAKPKNEKMRMQTIFLGMGKGKYEFGGSTENIVIGEGQKSFDIDIYKEIVNGPKIPVVSKAGLFLNALKHLGVDVKGGDMRIYIGMKLELEDVPHNEAIRRFNEAHPNDKDISELSKEYAEKSGSITIPVRLIGKRKSLKQEVFEFADGKTENDVIAWCKAENKMMSDVFDIIDHSELVDMTNGVYDIKKEAEK
jgi:hypothetical protein